MRARAARTAVAAALTAVAGLALVPMPGHAARPSTAALGSVASSWQDGSIARERKGNYDVRVVGTPAPEGPVLGSTTDGDAAVLLDPLTGTVRYMASLDGFLTGPASGSQRRIALSYVRTNASALGLDRRSIRSFQLRTGWTDPAGTRHLSWTQTLDDIPVFGNGLRAHVDDDGRLVAVQGAPVAHLDGTVPGETITAEEARAAATEDVGGVLDEDATPRSVSATSTVWSDGDTAEQVWFATPEGLRLAWSTVTTSGATLAYSHVFDAETGRLLYRHDLVSFARGEATVYANFPGARRGGEPRTVDFAARGWLSRGSMWLTGPNVRAWADLDDDDLLGAGERTGGGESLHPFVDHDLDCSKTSPCTWDPAEAYSWRVNLDEDVAQAFYLANVFHDHLAAPPFGFTSAAGGFDRTGGDPLVLHALDGAEGDGTGLPDDEHVDGATITTYPDGTSPILQSYLWHAPGTTTAQEPFQAASSSFDASIMFHEYAHAMAGRLVVDADGNSTLSSLQSRAVGEGSSDYLAMDRLVSSGMAVDTDRPGQVLLGRFVTSGGGQVPDTGLRTQALDCPVDAAVRGCERLDGSRGGYTYGDLAAASGVPDVHGAGEVWAQTLWDLRTVLGSQVTGMLVARGMELAPADPSMLDMRNAMLLADRVAFDVAHTKEIWRVFAGRGMGWFAGTIDATDPRPVPDFRVRPVGDQMGTLRGTVTDPATDEPVSGALVRVTGADGLLSSAAVRADESGDYILGPLPVGQYQKVVASAPGHQTAQWRGMVSGRGETHDVLLRDDVADEVVLAEGPDYTAYGCGPVDALDDSLSTGWGSTTGVEDDPTGTAEPKALVIALDRPVDIRAGEPAFGVDPTSTCNDAASSSLAEFTIEVSSDGESWDLAVDGTGDRAFGREDLGRLTELRSAVDADDVMRVRLTMLSPQVPDFETSCPTGPYAGCTYLDMTEIQVYGS